MNRRQFVVGAALAGPFAGLLANPAMAAPKNRAKGSGGGGYGELRLVKDATDGVSRLRLPEGFRYRSIALADSVMADGNITPGAFDGMDCFKSTGGKVRLVRNHETRVQAPGGPGAPAGSNPYDAACNGGTTTIEVDLRGNPNNWGDVSSWSSMTGTYFNCSGGASTYGTWFSCEELPGGSDLGQSSGPDPFPGGHDFFGNGAWNLEKKHGYVYEVDSRWGPGENPVPTPITQAGRFTHEGAVMDNATGYLYMTQDDFFAPSGLYRYIPPNNAQKDRKVEDGGTLEMLRVVGIPNAKLFEHQEPGATYQVDWVKIPDPDPTYPAEFPWIATLGSVSSQGQDQGAAGFSRLEGIRRRGRKMYFNSTQGGQGREGASSTFGPGFGQVWVLDLARMQLSLVFEAAPVPGDGPIEPGNLPALSLPDNIAISPKGALVLCEDGTIDAPDRGRGFSIPHNFVRGLSRDGDLFDFAENMVNDSEFTGACFSPDGKSMFVNMQDPGITFEIRGGFGKGPW